MLSGETEMQPCNHCGKSYPATREFFGSQPNGNLRRKCRTCVREHVARYAEEHPGAAQQRSAVRADRGGGQWSTEVERKRLFGKYNGICVCCGRKLTSAIDAHVDHMVPIARGGQDVLSNAALIHSQCNAEKHNKTLEEHWAWRVKVGLDKEILSWGKLRTG